MIFKLLGAVALLLGIVFALLTLAVLLPFLGNFNLSLLALIVLFGIFALVFLSVGWQLLHPPKPTQAPAEDEDEDVAIAGASAAVRENAQPVEADAGAPAAVGVSLVGGADASSVQTPPVATAPAVLGEEDYVTAVAAGDSACGPPAAVPGPVEEDGELDFSWVSPAPRRGATFVGLDEAHTELEKDGGPVASSDGQQEDPYYLRPHGYFRKPGAPVHPEGSEE